MRSALRLQAASAGSEVNRLRPQFGVPLQAASFSALSATPETRTAFWVISKEDLILSKLAWAKDSSSEKQFGDIRSLVESGGEVGSLKLAIRQLDLGFVWAAFEEWKIRVQK